MKPKISFVMPAYNAEHTIANAINSILKQTIEDWELIIVNDSSEDSTYQQAAKFKDERIKIIPQKVHKGLVEARNLGCSLALADIIAHQDADDLSLPDRAEKTLEVFDENTDVLYHGIYRNAWDNQYQCIQRDYIPAEEFNLDRLLKEQYINGVSFFRKTVWNKKPFRKETEFAFDYMEYLDWALSGFKFNNLNIGLYEYVRHENSASFTYAKDGRRQESMNEINKVLAQEYGINR